MKQTRYRGYILRKNDFGDFAICEPKHEMVLRFVDTLSEAFSDVDERVEGSHYKKLREEHINQSAS